MFFSEIFPPKETISQFGYFEQVTYLGKQSAIGDLVSSRSRKCNAKNFLLRRYKNACLHHEIISPKALQ